MCMIVRVSPLTGMVNFTDQTAPVPAMVGVLPERIKVLAADPQYDHGEVEATEVQDCKPPLDDAVVEGAGDRRSAQQSSPLPSM